jgi:hypothetical protein
MRRLVYVPILGFILLLGFSAAVQADRLPGSDQGGRPLTATLIGPNEIPPAPGTSSGAATVTINLGQGELCYMLTFSTTETVVAAHIHHAAAGSVAAPLIPLTAPVSGSSSGCNQVDQTVLKDILQNPEQYYVNVHTTAHPGGAGRGQLTK